jgi:hypothetical protein
MGVQLTSSADIAVTHRRVSRRGPNQVEADGASLVERDVTPRPGPRTS